MFTNILLSLILIVLCFVALNVWALVSITGDVRDVLNSLGEMLGESLEKIEQFIDRQQP